MTIEAASIVDAFVTALGALPRDAWLALPGVGWMSMRRYPAYRGISPRTGEPVSVAAKLEPQFWSDPEIYAELAGEPPSGEQFADERARFLSARQLAAADEPELVVVRDPAADAVAAHVRAGLLAGVVAGPEVTVPGLGVFVLRVHEPRPGADPVTGAAITVPGRRVLVFRDAPEVSERLAAARAN